MLSPRNRRRHNAREAGQALIILLVSLFVVLGFAGLAADAGHSYLTKRDVQNAADAAALAAGKQLIGAVQNTPPQCSMNAGGCTTGAAPTAANGFAKNNGYATTLGNTCDAASATSFTTTWVDSGSCSSTSGATTVMTIHDPPVVAPDGTPVPSACNARPYNCFQVVLQTKVTNYIMGLFGFPTTTITASATVNATPAQTGYPAPPAIAVYLYEPTSKFDTTQTPSRSNESCPAGATAGTIRCPTFLVPQQPGSSPVIQGIDGKNLTPATDTVALESNGDMVIQGQTTICDPYNGAAPCSANHATGTLGWATPSGALTYCQKLNGNVSTACTAVGPGASTPNQLWGNQTTFAAPNPLWTPTVTTAGLPDCSTIDLVLNGESVASDLGGQPCAPPASSPYTIPAAKYHSITINHGVYEFGSGLFDITGKADVNTQGSGGNCGSHYTANGIDHCREKNNGNTQQDIDLCDNNAQSPTACPNLTAGVWIGHGGGNFGAFTSGTAASCTGGSAGTDGGGGDNTQVSGSGVSFRFESSSAGFVSTNEVQLVSLTAPGLGASDAVNDVPLLFDEENNSFMHLDSGSGAPSGAFSQFTGIIYQSTTATGGGVEMNSKLSNNNGGGLAGQLMAYSLDIWNNGTAVDFSQGWGTGSSPKITTSGNAENSVIASPSPTVTAAVDHSGNPISGYETFTVNYSDEWALDGYDTYVRVNGASPVFFSQNEWGPQPAQGAGLPPEGASNSNPNDYAGPPSEASWPYPVQASNATPNNSPSWPVAQGTVTYPNGGVSPGYTAYKDNTTGNYDDWVETLGSGSNTSYFETSGSWTWGHQHDIAGGNNGSYTAQIKYTFPTPSGNSVALSVFLTDGDHCGDYATASYSFANVGQPNGGTQTAGTVELLE